YGGETRCPSSATLASGSSATSQGPPGSSGSTSSSPARRGGRSGSPIPTSRGRRSMFRRSGPRRSTAGAWGSPYRGPATARVSRAGFRSLLEAGIRVFEWKGPMLHAKTAVCDGLWGRAGSTNLNVVSWLSNYELDVALEDSRFAAQLEGMFLADLENSTELVL